MFGKKSDIAKPAMLGGSAAMMLKGMGIDPAQVENVAEQLIEHVGGAHARLGAIEARLDELEPLLRAIAEKLGVDADASDGEA